MNTPLDCLREAARPHVLPRCDPLTRPEASCPVERESRGYAPALPLVVPSCTWACEPPQ